MSSTSGFAASEPGACWYRLIQSTVGLLSSEAIGQPELPQRVDQERDQ